jgi:hypothetical protein
LRAKEEERKKGLLTPQKIVKIMIFFFLEWRA